MISEDMTAATFSLESEAGISPSSSPAGKGRSGPDPAPASRSASPAKAQGKRTPDTCGPLFTASSPSADLQRCLANKLQGLTDVNGSPEFALIWKDQDMPWGPPICALRASGRRTSDSGFGGWPTPQANEPNSKPRPSRVASEYLGRMVHMAGLGTPRVTTNGGHGNPERAADGKARLEDQVHGWPTPQAEADAKQAVSRRGGSLTHALKGWATPAARDHKSEAGPGHDARMAETRGKPLSRQTATTGGRGALAPEFSRWLMGYPEIWCILAPSAKRRV